MLNERVEIIDETNFYESMEGKIIQVEPKAVLVEIPFTLNNVQKVWFYKHQVKVVIG